MKAATLKADVLLLLAASIWGGAFVAQRVAMDHMGPWAFNAIRFALGTLVLLPVIWMRGRRDPGPEPASGAHKPRAFLIGGMIAGCVVFIAAGFQQHGLQYTTAGKAGFITGLYVVFVPMIGVVIGHKMRLPTWLAAGLAAVGLYFLSVSSEFEVNRGDWEELACAACWAVHVLIIARYSPQTDPIRFAATQFVVAALLALAVALWCEPIEPVAIWRARWAILFAGAISVGIAYTLQVVAQRTAPPAHAAILLSLEAVFAAIAGGLLLGETLDQRQLTGCALMLTGMLVSQIRRITKPVPVP